MSGKTAQRERDQTTADAALAGTGLLLQVIVVKGLLSSVFHRMEILKDLLS